MSAIKQRISDATKAAMRDRDGERLAILRLMNAAMKQIEVDSRVTLDDAGVLGILERMLKQRAESERMFREGNRPDLADKEAFEQRVVREFMPERAADAEIDAAVAAAIVEANATGPREMGAVMALLKARLAGRADMRVLSEKVRARLAG